MQWAKLLGRAVKRGEIYSTVNKELVLDLLFGLSSFG